MIEKGRHLKIDKNERFCKFCPNSVEDEAHFLISCETFKTHRRELFRTASEFSKDFIALDNKLQFITLLNSPNIIQSTAKYLYRTLQIRDFLLKNPKNNM